MSSTSNIPSSATAEEREHKILQVRIHQAETRIAAAYKAMPPGSYTDGDWVAYARERLTQPDCVEKWALEREARAAYAESLLRQSRRGTASAEPLTRHHTASITYPDGSPMFDQDIEEAQIHFSAWMARERARAAFRKARTHCD